MAAEIPEPLLDLGYEDTQSIDDNIDSLYAKFIVPIDAIRSIAEAPDDDELVNNKDMAGVDNLKIDTVSLMESRVHAFYRLLGLPVVGGTAFYNSGFEPSSKARSQRYQINSKVSDKDKELMKKREQHHKLFSQMFTAQGYDATLFGLVQQYIKPFNTLDNGVNLVVVSGRESDIIPKLKKQIPAAADLISKAQANFASKMGYSISSVRHILKPFTTSPIVNLAVMPTSNQICVPFLKDRQATQMSASPPQNLLRPGIEFILRARLKDNKPDAQFLISLEKTLKQVKEPTNAEDGNVTSETLKSTLRALAEDNNIDNIDLNEIFGGFSTTQALYVKQLIKTLKKCIELLNEATIGLSKIDKEITFLPIPGVKGYEAGGSQSRQSARTKLEKNIIILTTKKMNADRDAEIDNGLGEFGTASFINLEKVTDYSERIEALTQKRNSLTSQGFKHLKTIEIITGEASGLGLVDIIAIYTALWAIDIEDLLALLDDDAFSRLYNFNILLRSDEVEKRNNGNKKDITVALDALSSKVSSILTFADSLYLQSFADNESGTPV